MHDVLKYFHHRLFPKSKQWYPILSVCYLTYACSFRCPYCSDGKAVPYWALQEEAPGYEEVMKIFTAIRKSVKHLIITGGEPLEHPEYRRIIKTVSTFDFSSVALTTNGFLLGESLEETVQSVTDLIVSIDTLAPEKADAWLGKKSGCFSVIMDNLLAAAKHRSRRCRMHISSVVTPHNIEDLYAVYAFSQSHQFSFAACPQLIGVHAHEALYANAEYRRFYDFLISEKKKGADIFGSIRYLAAMRDLESFRCRPFTMLVVSPGGEVFYPCLEKGTFAGNLLAAPSLTQLRQEGELRHGPPPRCSNQCHSACALGFATMLDYPSSLLEELMLGLKKFVPGHRIRYTLPDHGR